MLEVLAINQSKKLIYLSDDSIVPMVSFHDSEGDEVLDVHEASYTVFQLPNGKWSYLYFAEFVESRVN